nr:MAG TPA: hypothetical protein [Caudoviricetes sp.]
MFRSLVRPGSLGGKPCRGQGVRLDVLIVTRVKKTPGQSARTGGSTRSTHVSLAITKVAEGISPRRSDCGIVVVWCQFLNPGALFCSGCRRRPGSRGSP